MSLEEVVCRDSTEVQPKHTLNPNQCSSQTDFEEHQQKQITMAQKQAEEIQKVVKRSPILFEDLLDEIEQYATMLNWNDKTKNCVLLMKCNTCLMRQINFDINWTWEETTKQLGELRFTYSFRQIYGLLNRFKKGINESFKSAISRLLRILRFRNIDLESGSNEFQRYVLFGILKKIFPAEHFDYLELRWDWELFPYKFNTLLSIAEKIDDKISRDGSEIVIPDSMETCYYCGRLEHSGACVQSEVNQDQSEKLNIIEDAIATFKDISEDLHANIQNTNDQLRNDFLQHLHSSKEQSATIMKFITTIDNGLQNVLENMVNTHISNSNPAVLETLQLLRKDIFESGEPRCKKPAPHKRRKQKSEPGPCWRCKNLTDQYHWKHMCPNEH